MVSLLSHLFNINHLVTALLNEDGIAHMLKVKHLIKCFVTALCTVPCSTSKRHFSRFRKLWREPSAAVWLSFYTEQNFFNLTHCNWKQYWTSMWNREKKGCSKSSPSSSWSPPIHCVNNWGRSQACSSS